MDVFFEYVRSKANIGDLPSRLAMDELWEMFETLGVASRACEIAMVMPRFHDWYAPAARLVSVGVAAAAAAAPSRKRAVADGGRDTSAARKSGRESGAETYEWTWYRGVADSRTPPRRGGGSLESSCGPVVGARARVAVGRLRSELRERARGRVGARGLGSSSDQE